VAGHGRSKVEPDNVTTAADLGLRRDEIHEARKLRDAEAAEPGVIRRSLDAMIERRQEPTRAALGGEAEAMARHMQESGWTPRLIQLRC
jgi:hypothetical protein